MKRFLYIGITLLSMFIASGVSSEEQRATDILFQTTSAIFQNIKGQIIKIEGPGRGIIDIGRDKGVVKRMRLRVYKPGVPFKHPVTGETIGTTEEPVGMIEVTEVSSSESKVRLIEGYMKEGYKVATQQEPFKVLFYQDTGVDYFWADKFHKKLSSLKNITLIDAPIEDYSDDKLFELADKKEADLILALSGSIEKDRMVVKERLLWADGVEVFAKTVEVPLSEVRTLRKQSGEEVVAMDKPLLVFTLPMNARMMVFGDFDGDHTKELAVGTDDEITIYRVHPAELQEVATVEVSSSDALIWLDSIDFDKDGRDEIVLTYYDGIKRRPISHVIKIENFIKDRTD
ncbi:MAG: VCBS repeat-containing protein, partial [Nitrospirae bacterium]